MSPYNSTIRIKKRACTSCGRESIIFSRGRCAQCSKIESFHAQEEKEVENEGLSDLISDLDVLVSKWVRYSNMDKEGLVKCYTCRTKLPPGQMDAGHYMSRKIAYLRFDTSRNIRPQCVVCNRAKYGKAAAFGKNLELELPGVTEILLEESRIVHRWGRDELRSMISEYTQKIKLLNNV